MNTTQTKKVVPFNSMYHLNKGLNQDCHISTARTHKHTPKAQNKENAHTVIDQSKLPQYLSNVNSA